MNSKIIGVIICTLLIITVVLPVTGTIDIKNETVVVENDIELTSGANKCIWSCDGPNLDNWAITPPIDLSTVVLTATLSYRGQYEIDAGDTGYVMVSSDNGLTWVILGAFTGSQPNWKWEVYDITAWAGGMILVAFRYTTGAPSTGYGWHVDDITVEGDGVTLYSEDFESYIVGDPWGAWVVIWKPFPSLFDQPIPGGIYLFGSELFTLPIEPAIILGPITCECDPVCGCDGKVLFYVDDELKHIDDTPPYEWLWDETAFFKHTIKVTAEMDFDDDGVVDPCEVAGDDEIDVIIFNI